MQHHPKESKSIAADQPAHKMPLEYFKQHGRMLWVLEHDVCSTQDDQVFHSGDKVPCLYVAQIKSGASSQCEHRLLHMPIELLNLNYFFTVPRSIVGKHVRHKVAVYLIGRSDTHVYSLDGQRVAYSTIESSILPQLSVPLSLLGPIAKL